MHLRSYKLLALVLLLALGMGCGSSGTTTSGGVASGGDASLVGTWNLASGGGTFPQKIIINANGTGSYLFTGGTSSSFTWTQSGSTVTLSTGSAQAAVINNLSSPVGNTFALSSLGGTGIYTRA